MNRIKKKLNSRKGASITYALLIFLVCAVVGSAVLVAGTTAAGRMSEVVKSDQRYYAVTSAARMLIDQIDGVPVTIIKKDEGGTVSYIDGNGNPLTPAAPKDSLALEAAYYLNTSYRTNPLQNITLSAKDETTGTAFDALKVVITEDLKADGSMELTLSAETPGRSPSNNLVYSLLLFFNLDQSEPVESVDTSGGSPVTTVTRVYTWHLRDIQVSGSGVARG